MKGVHCDWNDDVHVVNSWATWTSPLQSQRIVVWAVRAAQENSSAGCPQPRINTDKMPIEIL